MRGPNEGEPWMSVYLDHAATSPLRPEALEAFVDASGLVGNASSLHRPGQRARRRLEEAREELAAAVGRAPDGGCVHVRGV